MALMVCGWELGTIGVALALFQYQTEWYTQCGLIDNNHMCCTACMV